MQTVLKTFRLPVDCAQFLEDSAKEKQTTQTEILLKSLEKMMTFRQQWEEGLKILAQNEDYKKEQILQNHPETH